MEPEKTEVNTAPKPEAPEMSRTGLFIGGFGIALLCMGVVEIVKILTAGSFHESDQWVLMGLLGVGAGIVWSSLKFQLQNQAEYLAALIKHQTNPSPEEPTP